MQRPKESGEPEPKVAADENPYGAKPMSLVLRMNRAEQNAGDFKVRLLLFAHPLAFALMQTCDRAGGL